ncbi:MAG: saccharopine dehydrogenase family protein [Myxococcales bacterium]|nr:saccharopine dehydrogenase family protein [Myxococcales bacterium]
MTKIAVLGAGKIGRMVAHFLGRSGDYEVRIGDVREEAALELASRVGGAATGHRIDFADERTLEPVLAGATAVLSCCPFESNPFIAAQAIQYDLHYLDLTEDIETTRKVLALEPQSKKALIPQCGLAPGFITITALHLANRMDEVETLKMRVGALPRFPSNMLKYNLTWSTEGLINEYANSCESLKDGVIGMVEPLEGLENITVDGVEYEAFNTSGGLGSLCRTMQGRVKNVDYKSIRYPGHCQFMRLLMKDLRMNRYQDTLKEIFERALPTTYQDQVVVYVSAQGRWKNNFVEYTYARTVHHQTIYGENWSAIQITTAAGLCGVLDLLLEGKLPQKGFVRQEDVNYKEFIENRFGRYYA